MTGVDWKRLFDGLDVDTPAVDQVAEALADATDTSVSRAYERVEAALDAGELIEEDTGGMFPGVAVASQESAAIPVSEDSSLDQNPHP